MFLLRIDCTYMFFFLLKIINNGYYFAEHIISFIFLLIRLVFQYGFAVETLNSQLFLLLRFVYQILIFVEFRLGELINHRFFGFYLCVKGRLLFFGNEVL